MFFAELPCRPSGIFLLVLLALPFSARADDLLGLYREAQRMDARYLAAQADTAARRELLPQARAQLLPNLSLSASRGRNSTEQKSGTVESEQEYDNRNDTLSLRQPVFRPREFAGWKQAGAQVESAEAALNWAGQEMALRLGSAYFDVLFAQAEVDVNRAQRDACQTQIDYAERAFRAGAGTRTDIDEARAQLDLTEARAIELQYQLDYRHDALSRLVDRPLTPLATLDPARLPTPLPLPDPVRLEEWVQKAENTHPNLIALRAQVEAATREIDKARAGHLPTLDLVAQRVKSESDSHTSIGNKYDTSTISLQLVVPLFAGGGVNASVRQAVAEVDKARQQLEAARRETGLQVRQAFDGVSQGVHWVRAYEQAVKSAEQSLLSTRKGFQAGTRNTVDILNAEQSLAAARRDLNRGRYQYMLARLQLLAQVGGLDEVEIARMNAWLAAE
ncbi:MAG: TolC family outer membrane protein [Azoarcus sp.]|jgi:TolC family type I secretion outer membrane protein|nr:TolC family outer membrane protein [Azoarcus sp.]